MVADIWQDMRYLIQLDYERQLPSNPDHSRRDGGPGQELGYKPRDPEDPMWLKVATWILLVITIAGIPAVLYFTNWR